ncbi:hypothetical protein C8039_19590 [Halogeometricum sp. wsp3]|nr:hypothetical protein C8039_19590 [Halogeometricum sp. wsp3]
MTPHVADERRTSNQTLTSKLGDVAEKTSGGHRVSSGNAADLQTVSRWKFGANALRGERSYPLSQQRVRERPIERIHEDI